MLKPIGESSEPHAIQLASAHSNCQTNCFASRIIRVVPRGSLVFFVAQCERVLARAKAIGQETDLTNWSRAAGLSRGTMQGWKSRADIGETRLYMEVANVEDAAEAAGKFGVDGVTAGWLLWGIGAPPRGIDVTMRRPFSDPRMEHVVVAMESVLRREMAGFHVDSVDSGIELFKLRSFPESASLSEMAARLREDVREAAQILAPAVTVMGAPSTVPPPKSKERRR
jgi:hypothetical protein